MSRLLTLLHAVSPRSLTARGFSSTGPILPELSGAIVPNALVLRGVPFKTTSTDIRKALSERGFNAVNIRVASGHVCGFAHIDFATDAEAATALSIAELPLQGKNVQLYQSKVTVPSRLLAVRNSSLNRDTAAEVFKEFKPWIERIYIRDEKDAPTTTGPTSLKLAQVLFYEEREATRALRVVNGAAAPGHERLLVEYAAFPTKRDGRTKKARRDDYTNGEKGASDELVDSIKAKLQL